MRLSPSRFLAGLVMLLSAGASRAPAQGASPVAPVPPTAPETTRYVVLLGGRPAGSQRVWTDHDGVRRVEFAYTDRGRGATLAARVTLDSAGVPTMAEVRGQDYLKNAIDERYRRPGTEVADPGYFLSSQSIPQEAAWLVAALRRRASPSMRLVPRGTVQLVEAGHRTVRAQVDGITDSLDVVQWLLTGLDFAPTPVWLDASGRLFAMGSANYMTIRAGWEDATRALVQAQRDAIEARASDIAHRLAHAPRGGVLVLRDATLFDPARGRLERHRTVVVRDGRIAAVEAEVPGTRRRTPLPDGDVVDLEGRVLLPGLWDMHVHLAPGDGMLHLASGVTTVRDLANDIDALHELRERFEAGSQLGPRVVMAGIIDGPGPYAGPTKVLVATDSAARAAVRRYASLGYQQIKIYSSVDSSLVRAIVDEAHGLGLRVSGHVPAFMSAEDVVRDGFDEIQHVNFLFLNFWTDAVPDTRSMARVTSLARDAATLDLASPRVRAFVALLRERGTVIDPTVNVFERLLLGRPGVMLPGYDSTQALPVAFHRTLTSGGLPVPPGMDARYAESFTAVLRMVRLLYDSGVPIVAGTDGLPGFSLVRELELYEAAGIPDTAILRIATLGAARTMHMDHESGTVSVGKRADMIVLDADPTRGIGALRSVRTVFKGGIRYDVAALRGALGIGRPQGPAGPVAHLSHARVAVAEPCLAQRRCVPPPAGATARR